MLAETEPEYEVSVEGGREGQDKIRLVDDVFSKVCQVWTRFRFIFVEMCSFSRDYFRE